MVIGYHVHKTRIIRGTSEFFNIRTTRFSTFETLHFKKQYRLYYVSSIKNYFLNEVLYSRNPMHFMKVIQFFG